MKLIFVRHAEPDYINDSLTENGEKEAQLLAERIADWKVTQFYVSPQGRAQKTASYSLLAQQKEAITLDYLREFSYKVNDPISGRIGVPWDFVSSDWTKYDFMFKEGDAFCEYPCIKNAETDIKKKYHEVIDNFDKLLEEYGFRRNGRYYTSDHAVERYLKRTVSDDNLVRNNKPDYPDDYEEPVLVFFCHLGVTCVILSHLLNIPFETLTHGFFIPPTGLTILSSEERWGKEAYFRVQTIGDMEHLKRAGHPISPAGYFADVFQG